MATRSVTETTIDIGHTEVVVAHHGEPGCGPDLVFVHGWPLFGATWRNVVADLTGFRCHVIDLPGAGKSFLTTDTPMTVLGHADSLGRVLDGLGLDRFGLIGHDSGAMIARYTAVGRTDVAGIGVIGSEIPGNHPAIITLLIKTSGLPTMPLTMRTLLGKPAMTRNSTVGFGDAFYDRSLLDGEFRRELLDPVVADERLVDGAVQLIRNLKKSDIDGLADAHAELTMPSLFIYGADDTTFFPADKARTMTEQFAGPTTFVEIPKAKLLVHEEHPEQTAEHIAAFFAELF